MKKLVYILFAVLASALIWCLLFNKNDNSTASELQSKFAKENELSFLYNIKDIKFDSDKNVNLEIDFKNMSDKNVKKVNFYVIFDSKNNKDIIGSDTVVEISASLNQDNYHAKTEFKNTSVACVEVKKIEVEYEDKTKYSIDNYDILNLANNGFLNYLPKGYSKNGIDTKECQEEY